MSVNSLFPSDCIEAFLFHIRTVASLEHDIIVVGETKRTPRTCLSASVFELCELFLVRITGSHIFLMTRQSSGKLVLGFRHLCCCCYRDVILLWLLLLLWL